MDDGLGSGLGEGAGADSVSDGMDMECPAEGIVVSAGGESAEGAVSSLDHPCWTARAPPPTSRAITTGTTT
jgi:hypothetical protein